MERWNTLNFFCFYVRYESHYALPLGRKKGAKLSEADEKILSQKRSSKTDKKYKERQKDAKVDQALNDQFLTGTQNIFACKDLKLWKLQIENRRLIVYRSRQAF